MILLQLLSRQYERLLTVIILVIGVYMYVNKAPVHYSVIAVEEGTTRILTESEGSFKEQEAVNFLRQWTELYFNYSSKNIEERLGAGSQFLSPSLWSEQEEQKFIELVELSKKIQIYEKGRLTSIDYSEETDTWVLSINSEVRQNGELKSARAKIEVKLVEVKRTNDDRWGIQINELSKKI